MDVLARSLRTGVDETIAVVVPTIGDPFFASMIEEIERAAFEGRIKVLVATNSRDPQEEQRVIDSLLARRVAGIIVTPFLADYSFLTAVRTRWSSWTVDPKGWIPERFLSTTTDGPSGRPSTCVGMVISG